MRKIIIGFSRPKGWFKPFSWVIRLFEKTKYSHVYVKTYSGMANSWIIYQASGAQVNFIGQRLFGTHAFPVKEFEFDISDEAYKRYMTWAVDNAGSPYGIRAVIGIAIMKLLKSRKNILADGMRSQYCAELAARALHDFMRVDIEPSEFETAGPKRIYEICELLKFKETSK